MIRAALCGCIALVAAACSPDIGSGTYFCGPERLCPEDLECDGVDFVCVLPSSVRPFECGSDAVASEPDDSMDDAVDIGTPLCGTSRPLVDYTGCIAEASDADLYKFVFDDCGGSDPHVELRVRHPIGLADVRVEILDESGSVLGTAEICTEPGDFTGTELLCLEVRGEPGTYFVRFATPSDAPNCDGECHFNQYDANIAIRLN